MADALSKSGLTRSAVRAVCLAVSGVNHPTDQHRILNWLRFVSSLSIHFTFVFLSHSCYKLSLLLSSYIYLHSQIG